MMNLSPINALSWVRSRPAQFFGSEIVDPIKIAAYIMADAMAFGCSACTIRHQDDWWAVSSDFNWLSHKNYSVQELFANVISEPKHGEHSMRAEIIVNAFSESVFVAVDAASFQISGQTPPENFISAAPKEHFCVFFKPMLDKVPK